MGSPVTVMVEPPVPKDAPVSVLTVLNPVVAYPLTGIEVTQRIRAGRPVAVTSWHDHRFPSLVTQPWKVAPTSHALSVAVATPAGVSAVPSQSVPHWVFW